MLPQSCVPSTDELGVKERSGDVADVLLECPPILVIGEGSGPSPGGLETPLCAARWLVGDRGTLEGGSCSSGDDEKDDSVSLRPGAASKRSPDSSRRVVSALSMQAGSVRRWYVQCRSFWATSFATNALSNGKAAGHGLLVQTILRAGTANSNSKCMYGPEHRMHGYLGDGGLHRLRLVGGGCCGCSSARRAPRGVASACPLASSGRRIPPRSPLNTRA